MIVLFYIYELSQNYLHISISFEIVLSIFKIKIKIYSIRAAYQKSLYIDVYVILFHLNYKSIL